MFCQSYFCYIYLGMKWLRPDCTYGEVVCPDELTSRVENHREGDLIVTNICITNRNSKPVFTTADSIRISFPLEDKYEGSDICMMNRCHTHIFCGGDISYIMALRMGGEAPHLGMVLTKGSLFCYSVKRDISHGSNDRGCFYLHPSPMELQSGESRMISWIIFPHGGKEDFKVKLRKYSRFLDVRARRYVLFPGERNRIMIRPGFETDCVMINGEKAAYSEGIFFMEYTAETPGEQVFYVEADGVRTWCRTYVHTNPVQLAEKRCRFIAEKQQYHGKIKELQGAYLIYDNEEKHMVYRPVNDHNGGRERVGMGLLIAGYLQAGYPDTGHMLEGSLREYADYVLRELVDADTGRVFNDIGKDDSFRRQYNLPWYAAFFIELYNLYKQKKYLVYACRILNVFYREGGAGFYPINLPIRRISQALKKEGMESEHKKLSAYFVQHADALMKTGLHYPVSEVNYEQSIVAPAADILLQVHILTGERKYLDAAERQIAVLDLFNGMQPDYHLYETAIRHWDGYWFGKYRLYGDTFPHYWSALTGNVFALYAQITGNEEYAGRAEDSIRGVLPMIFPDGSASCAYLYPHSVNGTRAEFYEPYANDQDWGLYFYLCMLQEKTERQEEYHTGGEQDAEYRGK